ncbi:uncharacterized protein DFL_002044 [Arthrobotrys flagrans]|uniref:Thioredoxin domain-containing protein n=1 Tax=Arthrobotrys flagrans TaxID=97331 RepID=A0A437AAE1_ARTFL|nr:hypothetical protein DFL_002044 [Arthrobotrys flagrans]
MSGSGSTSAPRLCWQRSPRNKPVPYAHDICSIDDLDDHLSIDDNSVSSFLYFSSDKYPHHRLIAGSLERLATIYHPRMLFCFIDTTRLGDELATPIIKRYEIDTECAAAVIILENGEKKSTLQIPFMGEKQAMEDFIRNHLGLERISRPGFGPEGVYTHHRSGTTAYCRES